ncbi:MAG: hypothetical protein CMK59_08430 [Proteobacteria bacterium]|nr:hypothetical protein [Pseudomonadota bacterium]
MEQKKSIEVLQNKIDVLTKFPDHNPNPVLKMDLKGTSLYSNTAGLNILNAWGIELGESLPGPFLEHVASGSSEPLEYPVGASVFLFHIVSVPQFEFVNIYGTDITAKVALVKFPEQNPNPVLKTSMDWKLLYANSSAQFIPQELGLKLGDSFPDVFPEHFLQHKSSPLELEIGSRFFSFHIVQVPEFDCFNIYGTDITAAKDNEQIMLKLAKYFSPQVYESIFSGDLEVKIQSKRKQLTVFFSDIKGFSELTERLEPELLTTIVTDYLTAMTNIVVKYGGTVDKYIGDAIMVFFGDPHTQGPKKDAVLCAKMALEMKGKLWEIRKQWHALGIAQPLDIRIGIHSDICTVGNFGSLDRLDYTTIGNGVNLASRLESNASTNQILISEDTYMLIKDEILCHKKDEILVKNIKHPIQTYEVKGVKEELSEPISSKKEGFSLFLDPSCSEDVEQKRRALEEALRVLNRMS